MPALKTYRLFISHAWDYNDEYYRLTEKLKEAKRFISHNYSVPEHDPLDTQTNQQLREALTRHISPVHCVLVLAGMYTNHRKWIQAEIEIAQRYGKPIIGVQPWGQQRMPVEVQNAAVCMVGWNTISIVQAIRDHAI